MTDGLELPRCRICGTPLMPETGVAFRAGSRVLFVTCRAHAQLASDGSKLLMRLGAKGLGLFLEEKAPNLFDALKGVYTEHQRLKEKSA